MALPLLCWFLIGCCRRRCCSAAAARGGAPRPPRGAASSESSSIAPAPLLVWCGVAMVWCGVVAATAWGSRAARRVCIEHFFYCAA